MCENRLFHILSHIPHHQIPTSPHISVMKKKDMIFDFYIDKSQPGKPLRACTFCSAEWKNNDRRRLIDHMIGCLDAPIKLKEILVQRDKQDALKKQAQTQQRQATQQMAVRNHESDHRKRIRSWIEKTEEEAQRKSPASSNYDEFEEVRPRDKITREESENLDRLLVKMIYQCELPVSLVEQPSFLAYIKSIRPAYYNYGLPKKADIAAAIVQKSEERVKKVRRQMGGVDFLGQHSRSQDASFHQQEGGRDVSYRSQGLSDRQSRDLGIGSSRNNLIQGLSPESVIRERELHRYPSPDPKIAQSRNIVSTIPSPDWIVRQRRREMSDSHSDSQIILPSDSI